MIFINPDPNVTQKIRLAWVRPSDENIRLFVEKESLEELREVYRRHKAGEKVILPDAPILRLLPSDDTNVMCPAPVLEILAGERRITAASMEMLDELDARVTIMTDEEAFDFIAAHNDVASITTVEMAYRAAEMERLGIPHAKIAKMLKGASPGRYITVGQMVDPSMFSNQKKKCNPSIVEWHEAALFGPEHFTYCFEQWDSGVWDETQCSKNFRKRGSSLPLDNAEKGFRVTFDNNRLVIRGQLNLDFVTKDEATAMLDEVRNHVNEAIALVGHSHNFGPREVFHINPDTV